MWERGILEKWKVLIFGYIETAILGDVFFEWSL